MSALTTEESVRRLLEFPDLVMTNDLVQLEMALGIRTNSYTLGSMMRRCTDAALQYTYLSMCVGVTEG